jgi:BCD family chlorophyll transporter-like MFS transporter
VALSGALRDGVSVLAAQGVLGPALTSPAVGYGAVYHVEIALLFAALVAIGPLVRPANEAAQPSSSRFGLAEFPG